MNPLISVVIPVYKVERYLHECVNSVLSQTYKNLEVVLVDDGSPDLCPKICDDFAHEDSRVKVVHKPNGGLSDARNIGIDNATGQYILFLDGDDFWIDTESIEKLVATLRKCSNAEIIFFGRTTFIGNKTFATKRLNPKEINNCAKNVVLRSILADGNFVSHACLKLIKLSVIRDNQIYFQKGLLSEDWDWSISLYLQANEFAAVAENFYGYRKREGSITQNFSIKHAQDILFILDKWTDQLPDIESSRPFLGFLAYIYCCTLASNEQLPKTERTELRKLYMRHKKLLKYNDNPKVKKVYQLYRAMGYRFTCNLLGLYLKHRSKRLH